jgi:hypothetical protein
MKFLPEALCMFSRAARAKRMRPASVAAAMSEGSMAGVKGRGLLLSKVIPGRKRLRDPGRDRPVPIPVRGAI